MAFVYALIVPLWADQLVPQLLMKQFDTCRYNVYTLNICMKEFIKKNLTLTIIGLYGFCICMNSAFMGQSNSTTAFDGAI